MPSSILIVHPSPRETKEIQSVLEGLPGQVFAAGSAAQAFEVLKSNEIDLLVLSPVLSDGSGIDFLKGVREKSEYGHLPALFYADPGQRADKTLAFEAGAQEFLICPCDPEELFLRAKNLIHLKNTHDELNRRIKELEKSANVDPLTALFNRKYLMDALHVELARSRRHRLVLGCLMIDIDNFKPVNDTMGHGVGDRVLKEIARRFNRQMRGYDFTARYGGDEFVVLLPQTTKGGCLALAERMRHLVDCKPFLKGEGREIHLSVSVGIAAFPGHEISDEEQMLLVADRALYEAKQVGRNCIAIAETLDRFRVQPHQGMYRRNYRKYQRYPLISSVRLTVVETQACIKAHAVNISYGGLTAYAYTVPPEKGQVRISISFTEPTGEPREETLLGSIRWVKPVEDFYVLGLEFEDFNAQDHRMVWGFIQEAERLSP